MAAETQARKLQRWVSATTGARKHRDAYELVLRAGGQAEPLWRAELEQVKATPAKELAEEIAELAESHAGSRGGSVRFHLQWLDDGGRILQNESWREGSGDMLDGTSDALATMQQKMITELLAAQQSQAEMWLGAFAKLTTALHEENTALRAELRGVRLDAAEPPSDDTEGKPNKLQRRGSYFDEALARVVEHAGKEWVDEQKAKRLAAGESGKPKDAGDDHSGKD